MTRKYQNEDMVDIHWNGSYHFGNKSDKIYSFKVVGFHKNGYMILFDKGGKANNYDANIYGIDKKYLNQNITYINCCDIIGLSSNKPLIIKCIKCLNPNEYANQDDRLTSGFYLCYSCNIKTNRLIIGL